MLKPIAAAAAVFLPVCLGRQQYATRIPNVANVKGCDGSTWPAVGHLRSAGGGARNAFGTDFAAANFQWTTALCQKDSDGDGQTNGQELGDPDCTWSPGTSPRFNLGITHPGINCGNLACDGSASATAASATGPLGCSAYSMPTTQYHDLAFPPHLVAPGTSYVKTAFTWPEATKSAVVRFDFLIRNPSVVHHMILYRCARNMANVYGTPSVGNSMGCSGILMAWAVGGSSFCAPQGVDFAIDPAAPYFILETHYDNPNNLAGVMDTSGMRLHFVPHAGSGLTDAGVKFVGANLPRVTVPARTPAHRVTATISAADIGMPSYFRGVDIFAYGEHMHQIGRKIWFDVVTDRTGAKEELACNTNYDFDLQQITIMPQSYNLKPGQSMTVDCVYDSSGRSAVTRGGDESDDEMCLVVIMFTPDVSSSRSLLVNNVTTRGASGTDHVCGCPDGVHPTPGAGGTGTVVYSMTVAGTVASFDAAAQDLLKTRLAAALDGVEVSQIHLSIAAGSVVVTVTITTPSAAVEASIAAQVNAITVAQANAAFAGAIVIESIVPARTGAELLADADAAWKRKAEMLALHATLMLVAWGLLLPTGALVPRTWRRALPNGGWFKLHWAVQASGVLLTLAGLVMAVSVTESHFDTTGGCHKVVGLGVAALAGLQLLIGLLRPHAPSQGESASCGRLCWYGLHASVGLALLGGSCYQVVSGAAALEGFGIGLLGGTSAAVSSTVFSWYGASLGLAAAIGALGCLVGSCCAKGADDKAHSQKGHAQSA